jgi:hypothetical protein
VVVRVALFLALALAAVPFPAAAQPACAFRLGFKALYDQIPSIVGTCVDDEGHNPLNGDGLQHTTAWHGKGGLLVWRKADNWTAFTDGSLTWINGPNGIQSRPNAGPLFPWEGAAPTAQAPPATAPPVVSSGPDTSSWAIHDDPDRSFRYPPDWGRISNGRDSWYSSPGLGGFVEYFAPYQMGLDAKPADFIGRAVSYWRGNRSVEVGESRSETINGFAAERRFIYWQDESRIPHRAWVAAIKRGPWMHYVVVRGFGGNWNQYEPILLAILHSYYPKGD